MSEDFVEISSDGFVPVKATPKGLTPLMKKKVQERVDQLNAKQRHREKPPEHDSLESYARDKVKQCNQLKGGGVVMGDLSQAEKEALNSDNDGLLRRQQVLREKAMRIMRERRLEGRTQRDYFQGYRGYEALSKQQGRLPNAPADVKDRDRFLEDG